MLQLRCRLNRLILSEVDLIESKQQVRWKLRRGFTHKKPKPFVIDPSYFTPGEPVSGSVEYDDLAKNRKFDFDMDSLQSRGFFRFQKQYDPPKNAREIVVSLVKSVNPKLNDGDLSSYELTNPSEKYELLSKFHEKFKHGVPNSLLYMIKTVGDAVEFYETPVNTNTPYDELIRSKSLPPNLHVQKAPLRFHPETDTLFGGVNAFTRSSNVVTGLRAKKKYKGFIAQKSWPEEDEE